MVIESVTFETENFSLEHLNDSEKNLSLIESFSITESTGSGLEKYLKLSSFSDEINNTSRTYLIKDKETEELVGYFSLRNGLITQRIPDLENGEFDSFPAIELSNFAINSNYKKNHPDVTKLGFYIFRTFIQPLAKTLAKYVGIYALYLYALPEDRLISHYQTMGFTRLPPEDEKFVQNHVKPKYDDGCIFMFQTL